MPERECIVCGRRGPSPSLFAIAMTFPNVDGLSPRLTRRLFARRTGAWDYPELPVHLYDLSPRTDSGRRAQALRAAFDVLHRVAYPIAVRTDAANAQFVLAGRVP